MKNVSAVEPTYNSLAGARWVLWFLVLPMLYAMLFITTWWLLDWFAESDAPTPEMVWAFASLFAASVLATVLSLLWDIRGPARTSS